MFLHERGTYQTLYFAFYFGSIIVRLCCAFSVSITLMLKFSRSDLSSLDPWQSMQALARKAGVISGGKYSMYSIALDVARTTMLTYQLGSTLV